MTAEFFSGKFFEYKPFLTGNEFDGLMTIEGYNTCIDGSMNSWNILVSKVQHRELPLSVLISTPTYMMGYHMKSQRVKKFIMPQPSAARWADVISKYDKDVALFAHKEGELESMSIALVTALSKRVEPFLSANSIPYSYTYPLPAFGKLSLSSFYSDPAFKDNLKSALGTFKAYQEAANLKAPEVIELAVKLEAFNDDHQAFTQNLILLEKTIETAISVFSSLYGFSPKVMIRLGPKLYGLTKNSESNMLEVMRHLGIRFGSELLFVSTAEYHLFNSGTSAHTATSFVHHMWYLPQGGDPFLKAKRFFKIYYDLEMDSLETFRKRIVLSAAAMNATVFQVPKTCSCKGCEELRRPRVFVDEKLLKICVAVHFQSAMNALVGEIEGAIARGIPLDQAIADRYNRSRLHANIASILARPSSP